MLVELPQIGVDDPNVRHAEPLDVLLELTGPSGVELDRVFDRSFRRAGNQILVPLGTFSGTDVKTVLRENFLRMFARRMAKSCLSSGRTWPRRSVAGTGLPCR